MPTSKFKSETLKQLWEHVSQETSQPDLLLEEWVNEVAEWVRLRDYQEKLHQEESLWLPTSNKAELEVLLGLGALSTALGCSPAQLVHALLKPDNLVKPSETEPPDLLTTVSSTASETSSAEITEVKVLIKFENSPETQADTNSSNTKEDYSLLLEALTDFQAAFELAVEQAEPQLDPQIFPVKDLEDYLDQLFDLVRTVLTRERTSYEQ